MKNRAAIKYVLQPCAVCELESKMHWVRGGGRRAGRSMVVNGGLGYVPLCSPCWDRLPPSGRAALAEHHEPFPTNLTGVEFVKWMEIVTYGTFETGIGIRSVKDRFDKLVVELGGTPDLLSDEFLTKTKNKRRQRNLIQLVRQADLNNDPGAGVDLLERAGIRACSCCVGEFEIGYDSYGRPWCGLCAVLTGRYGYCPLHNGPVLDSEKKARMDVEAPFDREAIDPELVPPSMLARYGLEKLAKKTDQPLQSKSEME